MPDSRTYVFVCGLHRSGTTVLTQNFGQLENCSVFENTGVTMDEGQFLQDVYAPDDDYGGVGVFGFDRRAHLTEASPLLTPGNISKLHASWEPHWDRQKTICVEKTPGNLLMTRFLQAAFDNACFVVLKRHPLAVSLATQKWSRTSLHSLFEHWLRCHEIYQDDKRHLKRVHEIKYEDYIANPAKSAAEIATFIGAAPQTGAKQQMADGHNQKYFTRWSAMLRESSQRNYYRHVARKFESRFNEHGYSLFEGMPAEAKPVAESFGSKLFGPLTCAGADLYAWGWRRERDCRMLAKQVLKRGSTERRGQLRGADKNA